MKVTYDEIAVLPEIIQSKIKLMQSNNASASVANSIMTEEEKIIVETFLSEGNKHSNDKALIPTETNSSPNNV